MKRTLLLLTLLLSLNGFGQELVDWSMSSCSEKSYPYFVRYRIISQAKNEDTLFLRIGIVMDCCAEPKINLTSSEDSLFIDVSNGAELICMCHCCFEIDMTISGIIEDSIKVLYMTEDLNLMTDDFSFEKIPVRLIETPLKYGFPPPNELKSFENYVGEINQFTDQGEKIGLWSISSEKFNYLIFYRLDDTGKSRTEWRVAYNLDGSMEDICGWNGLSDLNCADAEEYQQLFGIVENK